MSIYVFVAVYIPTVGASIAAFITAHWGYQPMICAIESLVLLVLFLLLFVLELIYE